MVSLDALRPNLIGIQIRINSSLHLVLLQFLEINRFLWCFYDSLTLLTSIQMWKSSIQTHILFWIVLKEKNSQLGKTSMQNYFFLVHGALQVRFYFHYTYEIIIFKSFAIKTNSIWNKKINFHSNAHLKFTPSGLRAGINSVFFIVYL